jgi:hypothetical protein
MDRHNRDHKQRPLLELLKDQTNRRKQVMG